MNAYKESKILVVAPCAGAWIEIVAALNSQLAALGRPLRGGVD